MKSTLICKCAALAAALCVAQAEARSGPTDAPASLHQVVDETVRLLMDAHGIPGMAIAVTVRKDQYFFNYGLASREDNRELTERTLFEIGSISKTFTATLASYAQEVGALTLADNASKYLPALQGSSFDRISLLDLGTYTAGGLPLQVPDEVTADTVLDYYKGWRPQYAPGTHRQYSNPSIGLFGHLAALSMHASFDGLMEKKLFPMMGLRNTYIHVPSEGMNDYAYGYAKDGQPLRVNPGVWDAEAYGVKTSAADLLRFIELNMDGSGLDPTLSRAISATHTGYYQVGDMVQALGWETYAYPTDVGSVLEGNSAKVVLEPNKARKLTPPAPPRTNVLINKSGSTNGFGGYVAFVPAEQIGVVILANKNYPVAERVTAAFKILTALDRHKEAQLGG